MTLPKLFHRLAANKNGELIIWQKPNFLLWLWIGTKIISFSIHNDSLKMQVSNFSKAVIFAWAYLEITQGESYFRRTLGLLVIAATTMSLFAK